MNCSYIQQGGLSVSALWKPVYDRDGYITHFVTPAEEIVQLIPALSVSKDGKETVVTTMEELKRLGIEAFDSMYSCFVDSNRPAL